MKIMSTAEEAPAAPQEDSGASAGTQAPNQARLEKSSLPTKLPSSPPAPDALNHSTESQPQPPQPQQPQPQPPQPQPQPQSTQESNQTQAQAQSHPPQPKQLQPESNQARPQQQGKAQQQVLQQIQTKQQAQQVPLSVQEIAASQLAGKPALTDEEEAAIIEAAKGTGQPVAGQCQCKLFIGGLSWDTNEAALREHFEHFGDVTDVMVVYNRTAGVSRGFGFVTFKDRRDAEVVISQPHRINNKNVEAKLAVQKGEQIVETFEQKMARQIFVGGLPPNTTSDELKEWAQALFGYDKVTNAIAVLDLETKTTRGFGFVNFLTAEMVDIAVQPGMVYELNDRRVDVKRAQAQMHHRHRSIHHHASGRGKGKTHRHSDMNGSHQTQHRGKGRRGGKGHSYRDSNHGGGKGGKGGSGRFSQVGGGYAGDNRMSPADDNSVERHWGHSRFPSHSPPMFTQEGMPNQMILQQGPMPGGPMQPMQGQPMQGQPMQGQPMQGQPMQGQPMQGQPMQGQPMQGAMKAQGLAMQANIYYQQGMPMPQMQLPVLPGSQPDMKAVQSMPYGMYPAVQDSEGVMRYY